MRITTKHPNSILYVAGMVIACSVFSIGNYAYNNLNKDREKTVFTEESKRRHDERKLALATVTKEAIADTCWIGKGEPYKLNVVVTLKGAPYGKSPTSCLYNQNTGQYAHIAYLNDQLVITQVFSTKEIQSQIAGGNK